MGANPTEEMIKKRVRDEIMKAFGTADKYIKEMKVEVIFKNVSYESLQNKEFLDAAKKAFPYVEFFYEEYDALKGLETK